MTSATRPHPVLPARLHPAWTTQVALAALTLLTLLVHGYHPFAEDGGVYAAGVRLTLQPTLYSHDRAFVAAHLHFSIFARTVAGVVRATHLSLEATLFALYVLSVWATLGAALKLSRQLVRRPGAQIAAVALLAAWWTLPVAGTSLVLLDPYLTARSFTTPLALCALALMLEWMEERRLRPALLLALCLIASAVLHPLMTAYTCALLVLLPLLALRRRVAVAGAYVAAAVVVGVGVTLFAPQEGAAVVAASLSRYYWFLSRWQWYELCGLVGPVAIFVVLLLWGAGRLGPQAKLLCRACIVLTVSATVVAFLFAHASGPTYLVARMQPLRSLLPVYAVMALLLGGTLTQWLVDSRAARTVTVCIPAAVLVAISVVMFLAQRSLYPASAHIELPWAATRNPWMQAFLFARDHTPPDALFALDADYITTRGEDAQVFRAIAQRSSLPDFSKDGGVASITPFLAARWSNGAAAQEHLSQLDDATRDVRLLPLGVTWMVLHAGARTAHPCPYDNGTVKVCAVSFQGQPVAALP